MEEKGVISGLCDSGHLLVILITSIRAHDIPLLLLVPAVLMQQNH